MTPLSLPPLAVSTHTAFLDAQVAAFTRHRARLAVVREQKAKARLDLLGESGAPLQLSSSGERLAAERAAFPRRRRGGGLRRRRAVL